MAPCGAPRGSVSPPFPAVPGEDVGSMCLPPSHPLPALPELRWKPNPPCEEGSSLGAFRFFCSGCVFWASGALWPASLWAPRPPSP